MIANIILGICPYSRIFEARTENDDVQKSEGGRKRCSLPSHGGLSGVGPFEIGGETLKLMDGPLPVLTPSRFENSATPSGAP